MDRQPLLAAGRFRVGFAQTKGARFSNARVIRVSTGFRSARRQGSFRGIAGALARRPLEKN
jgi:hypothetical protein